MNKASARAELQKAIASTSFDERQRMNDDLLQRLYQHPAVKTAQSIAAFCPIGREPNLMPLAEQKQAEGLPVFLPRWNKTTKEYEMAAATENLPRGPHGAPEPTADAPKASLEQLNATVWLIPGLGFDKAGTRLGRGGGFYDRLLAPIQATLIGVAYHNQLRENLPAELHDIRMHDVVTDTVTIHCVPPTKEPSTWNIFLESSDLSAGSSPASLSKKQLPPTS